MNVTCSLYSTTFVTLIEQINDSPVAERQATWSSQEGDAGSSARSARAPAAVPQPVVCGTRVMTFLENVRLL